jgi:hypothetical protein
VPACVNHDEHVLCVLPGINLLEPRTVRRSCSAYGGPTVRVMKGLSFRFGSGTAQSESFDELRHIDHGTLVITNKRLAFLGQVRTTSTELGDLIGVHAFADSIKVHRERKQRAEHYQLSGLQLTYLLGKYAVIPLVAGVIVGWVMWSWKAALWTLAATFVLAIAIFATRS